MNTNGAVNQSKCLDSSIDSSKRQSFEQISVFRVLVEMYSRDLRSWESRKLILCALLLGADLHLRPRIVLYESVRYPEGKGAL